MEYLMTIKMGGLDWHVKQDNVGGHITSTLYHGVDRTQGVEAAKTVAAQIFHSDKTISVPQRNVWSHYLGLSADCSDPVMLWSEFTHVAWGLAYRQPLYT